MQNKNVKTHLELIKNNDISESRLDNCHDFHRKLKRLAEVRINMSITDFINHWNNIKNEKDLEDEPITSLGLAELIFKGNNNFTDFTNQPI